MKQFKIYEIPGVKIGATDRWPQRAREQGYNEDNCNILFETDVLKLASSMEYILQKKHGYPVDKNRYETTYKASHGKIVSEETRARQSKAKAELAADPVRAAQRSQRMSKAKATIAADPIRAAQRSQHMSEAAIKTNAEIAADPVRYAAKSAKLSKANAEIAADPVRAATKSEKLSGSNSGRAKPILANSETYGCIQDAVDVLPFGRGKLNKLLNDPNNFNYQYMKGTL